ncbi:hypothetical protein M758_7G163700 [Ceratodon purpureus]|nr:hypothetical protein M758_7G163700 [Ceratodon purpureus]
MILHRSNCLLIVAFALPLLQLLCALCRASCDTAMAAAAITACSAIRLLPFTSAVFVRSSDCCYGSTTRRRFQSWRVCSASPKPSGVLTSDGGSANELVPAVVTTPFHLAIPVHDVHAAREFFGEVLGCPEGRSAKTWVDFNLFGHQVVCHEVRNYNASSSANAVDGDPVPVPHFGLAMSVPEFHAMAERVRAAGIKFIIEPHLRFVGQPGEQWTMFFKDYSGNALEFKAMTTPSNLFAKYVVE